LLKILRAARHGIIVQRNSTDVEKIIPKELPKNSL
jgi:hypothetical protein